MRPFRSAELLFLSVVSVLAGAIFAAYAVARLHLPLIPLAILPLGAGAGVLTLLLLRPRTSRDLPTAIAAVALTAFVGGWLLRLAHPSYLPLGGGPDLTHHLLLVDYLERHWELPDASMAPFLGEMTHYTPGLHLLAALLGSWLRTDGLHTIYLVVALSVALKIGLVFLIACRVLPEGAARLPLAIGAVALASLPDVYVFGSFLHDSFLAQVVAELFAVAMWWALVVWDESPEIAPAALFAMAGVATFLTWPIWVGPPLVVLATLAATRDELSLRQRTAQSLMAIGPVLGIAAVHTIGRTGWLGMAATSGAVVQPSIAALTWPFVFLGILGIPALIVSRRGRTTLLLLLAIAAQAATLYVVARARGATTPYMALKMTYLAIFPIAVAGALALALVWQFLASRVSAFAPVARYAAWIVVLAGVAAIVRVEAKTRLPRPTVSNDLYAAGRWARGHIEVACVDYLVPSADTAYWLHLAVLGNPRVSPRSSDPDTFEPARAVARWIEPGGLPYAVADVNTLPNDVRNNVDVLAQFGGAAVIQRRGEFTCDQLERLAEVRSRRSTGRRGRSWEIAGLKSRATVPHDGYEDDGPHGRIIFP